MGFNSGFKGLTGKQAETESTKNIRAGLHIHIITSKTQLY